MLGNTGEVFNKTIEKRAITFLQELIRENNVNPEGNELKTAEVIKRVADQVGLKTEILPISDKRGNLLVHLQGKDSNRKPLLFSGHLDTVPIGDRPWEYGPFSGDIADGKIYGRGACDMKSGVAAMLMSMFILKETGEQPPADIIFVGTAGEEIGSLGAKEFVKGELLNNAGAMVIGEPSNGYVYSSHKGALWLKVTTYGKGAHGSMPENGINAITHMNTFINKLCSMNLFENKEHHLLGKPTLNMSMIEGGFQANVVPDQCSLTIDIRTIPGLEHENLIQKINQMNELLNQENNDFHAELEVINDLSPLKNNQNCTFVQLNHNINHELFGITKEERGVNYFTDASVFHPALGIPIIIYGPGDEKLAHQTDEYVDMEQYLKAIQFYRTLALTYK